MLKATSILCAVLLLGLGATGCESKPKPTGAATSQAKSAAPVVKQSAAAGSTKAAATSSEAYADVDDKDIPDEADFEDEATKEITEENYTAKLDEIAKELGGDDEEGKAGEEKSDDEGADDEGAADEAPDDMAPDDEEP